ncbi:MAG: cell division protein FtsZ [Dehalococcoidia bacterium]|nr:cell division protein FtsZ [Dehalococcoidia bacterium]
MRLLIVGVGDCGCRLAGEFTRLNKVARAKQRVSVVSRAYAINDDQASLAALPKAGRKWLHPVLIRGLVAGLGKSNEAGAEHMLQESDRVMTAMRVGGFFEADAFLLIAGTGGSLGSGGLPVIAKLLKERYTGKPVYALIILPFESEAADPQRIHNTAVCLKSIGKVADAVILVDYGGLGWGDITSVQSMDSVNREIVFQFYDLLCAGEAVGSKLVGANVLDAGDIVQTLVGWTAIGVGRTKFRSSRFPWRGLRDFQETGSETIRAMEAMNLALIRLSIDCKLEDAGKALYLLSTPAKQANIDMVQVLGNRLREVAGNAEIRDGSFYGARGFVQVTVVVSELAYVEGIKNYYDRAVKSSLAQKKKGKAGRGKGSEGRGD